MADEIKQPPIRGGRTPGIPQFQSGGHKSVLRLRQLQYDPIGELVEKYRKLEAELEYQEKLRSGEIVELNAQGKPRSYRAEIHHAIYDRLIAVSDKLMRYKYGRVPETILVVELRSACRGILGNMVNHNVISPNRRVVQLLIANRKVQADNHLNYHLLE